MRVLPVLVLLFAIDAIGIENPTFDTVLTYPIRRGGSGRGRDSPIWPSWVDKCRRFLNVPASALLIRRDLDRRPNFALCLLIPMGVKGPAAQAVCK